MLAASRPSPAEASQLRRSTRLFVSEGSVFPPTGIQALDPHTGRDAFVSVVILSQGSSYLHPTFAGHVTAPPPAVLDVPSFGHLPAIAHGDYVPILPYHDPPQSPHLHIISRRRSGVKPVTGCGYSIGDFLIFNPWR